LKGSGLLTSDLQTFILQDASALLSNSPVTKKIAETIGNLGSKLDVLIHGASKRKRIRSLSNRDSARRVAYLKNHGYRIKQVRQPDGSIIVYRRK
jgi:hypothetical protein